MRPADILAISRLSGEVCIGRSLTEESVLRVRLIDDWTVTTLVASLVDLIASDDQTRSVPNLGALDRLSDNVENQIKVVGT